MGSASCSCCFGSSCGRTSAEGSSWKGCCCCSSFPAPAPATEAGATAAAASAASDSESEGKGEDEAEAGAEEAELEAESKSSDPRCAARAPDGAPGQGWRMAAYQRRCE